MAYRNKFNVGLLPLAVRVKRDRDEARVIAQQTRALLAHSLVQNPEITTGQQREIHIDAEKFVDLGRLAKHQKNLNCLINGERRNITAAELITLLKDLKPHGLPERGDILIIIGKDDEIPPGLSTHDRKLYEAKRYKQVFTNTALHTAPTTTTPTPATNADNFLLPYDKNPKELHQDIEDLIKSTNHNWQNKLAEWSKTINPQKLSKDEQSRLDALLESIIRQLIIITPNKAVNPKLRNDQLISFNLLKATAENIIKSKTKIDRTLKTIHSNWGKSILGFRISAQFPRLIESTYGIKLVT